MPTVAIIGAGGKMGSRAAGKIGMDSSYRVLMCEEDAVKAQRLEREGFSVATLTSALADADFVVLAVPDAAIGKVASAAISRMKPGATIIMLDAAAAYIGDLPSRPGINQMIAHPCHPPLFGDHAEGVRDYFGGITEQDIVVALMEGSREALLSGTDIAKAIFAPVRKSYEVTAEQFALLEPAMSEIIVGTAASLMKHSLDEVISKGVPADAAWAFMAGHVQIALAMVFGYEQAPFSDAAQLAVEWGTRELIRPEWRQVFERPTLEKVIRAMLHA